MRKIKKLKPSKEGLVVINPLTGLKIKESGESLVMSTYWVRRLKCGDVLEVKEESQEVSQPSQKPNKRNKSNNSEE